AAYGQSHPSFHSDRARFRWSKQSVLSFFASRSFFLTGELLLGNLSETVIVVGNAPHDRSCFLVCHLIGNRASFLCTKAPMRRIPNEVSGHQLASTSAPRTRKGPDHYGPGQVKQSGSKVQFGPSRSARHRAEPFIVPASMICGLVYLRQTFIRRCHWWHRAAIKTMAGSGRYHCGQGARVIHDSQ